MDLKFYHNPLDVVLYNASGGFGVSGDCGTLDYNAAAVAEQITAIGAFVAVQEAGKRMIPHRKVAIF